MVKEPSEVGTWQFTPDQTAKSQKLLSSSVSLVLSDSWPLTEPRALQALPALQQGHPGTKGVLRYLTVPRTWSLQR